MQFVLETKVPHAVHYASVHDSNPSTLRIIGLEVVTGSIRKGDRLRRLFQREDGWILNLDFPSLNEELDLTPYLWNDLSLWFLLVWLFSFLGGNVIIPCNAIFGSPCNGYFGIFLFYWAIDYIYTCDQCCIWHSEEGWGAKCISVLILIYLEWAMFE